MSEAEIAVIVTTVKRGVVIGIRIGKNFRRVRIDEGVQRTAQGAKAQDALAVGNIKNEANRLEKNGIKAEVKMSKMSGSLRTWLTMRMPIGQNLQVRNMKTLLFLI